MSLMDCPRYCAGVEHVSSVRVRLAFSHLGGEHSSLQEAQLRPPRARRAEHCLLPSPPAPRRPGDPEETPSDEGKEGVRGPVLAQMCQLAVAVPGVPGERQGLHLVEGEVAGQLGQPVVLEVCRLQNGDAGERVVCKLNTEVYAEQPRVREGEMSSWVQTGAFHERGGSERVRNGEPCGSCGRHAGLLLAASYLKRATAQIHVGLCLKPHS